MIDNLKRKVRKESKRVSPATYVIKSECDYYIEKVPLTGATKEEAETYFDMVHYIEPTNSALDCTGKPFTSWYKLFQKPDGSWWAYHCVNLDV